MATKFRLLLAAVLLGAVAWGAYSMILHMLCRAYIMKNDLKNLQLLVEGRNGLATAMLDDAYTEENREAFELLLKAGANPDGIRYQRLSLVHAAARNPNTFWLEKLLEHHANPNYHNVIRKIYPMMEAIEGNFPDNVRLLVKAGADVNVTTYRHQSMLAFAWSQRRGEIAMILLETGALINPPAARYESFINKIKRMSEDGGILNERDRIDEGCMKKVRQRFQDQDLDLKNATWDESQGDFGVWKIPPFPKPVP